MSTKAYARYRGCAPNAVRYQVRRGTIIPDPVTGLINVRDADSAWLLERRHGPQAWVMGPAQVRPDPAWEAALASGDLARLAELVDVPEVEPLSAEELAALLGEP
jgi:hypothetical protein